MGEKQQHRTLPRRASSVIKRDTERVSRFLRWRTKCEFSLAPGAVDGCPIAWSLDWRMGEPRTERSRHEQYFAVEFVAGRYDQWAVFRLPNEMTMPPNLRDYLYTGSRIACGILLVVGIVLFWAAVSFEGYLLALITLALAGCSFAGARELRPDVKPTAHEEQAVPALAPEDAGSTPGSA